MLGKIGPSVVHYLLSSHLYNRLSPASLKKAFIPVTQSPSEPPNDPRRAEPTTGPSRPLSFEEMVALLAAFLTLGSLLFWGLSRGGMNIFDDPVAGAGAPVIVPLEDAEVEIGEDEVETGAGIGSVAVLPGADDDGRLSARERLAQRAAARRIAATRRGALSDQIGVGTAGAAAGIATRPDRVTAEEPIGPTMAPEASTPTTRVAPSAAATAVPQDAINFKDVPEGYWAKPYIDALSSRELTAGFEDGFFRPDEPVTRAQIANIVSKAFELEADEEELAFSDVADGYWARERIEETVRGGFMTGYPDDTFAPDADVTRTEAFTTLVTGLGIEPPTDIQQTVSRYADADAIPNWANDKIAAATTNSLVVNYPNLDQLNPEQPTTRAELAAMIYQALALQGAVEPIDSEYVVQP